MPDPAEALAHATAKRIVAAFDGVIRIEAEGSAPLWIDGRSAPPRIGRDPPNDLAADERGLAVWRGSVDALIRALDDERALAAAYAAGRLAIAGDMSVMARLEYAR